MEVLLKSAALSLTAAVLCVLIKKSNPEIALLLALSSVCVIMISACGLMRNLTELADTIKKMCGDDGAFVAPVLKCLAISVITKISCELCKESSQSSAAAALEIMGTACALSVAMPAIMSMLKMIGGML